MKLRLIAAALGLAALTSAGCIITSAQILTHFDLPNPFTIDADDGFERIFVDLEAESEEYKDHKDKLKGLSDVAVLGTFTNLGPPDGDGSAGTVEVWITPGSTSFLSADAIRNGATKLWGPASIGAVGSSTETVTLSWDDSAALFNAAGKQILIDETLGDGEFTIYTTGSQNNQYAIRVSEGIVVLVLDGGQ